MVGVGLSTMINYYRLAWINFNVLLASKETSRDIDAPVVDKHC